MDYVKKFKDYCTRKLNTLGDKIQYQSVWATYEVESTRDGLMVNIYGIDNKIENVMSYDDWAEKYAIVPYYWLIGLGEL